jgi:hypothetical protein
VAVNPSTCSRSRTCSCLLDHRLFIPLQQHSSKPCRRSRLGALLYCAARSYNSQGVRAAPSSRTSGCRTGPTQALRPRAELERNPKHDRPVDASHVPPTQRLDCAVILLAIDRRKVPERFVHRVRHPAPPTETAGRPPRREAPSNLPWRCPACRLAAECLTSVKAGLLTSAASGIEAPSSTGALKSPSPGTQPEAAHAGQSEGASRQGRASFGL